MLRHRVYTGLLGITALGLMAFVLLRNHHKISTISTRQFDIRRATRDTRNFKLRFVHNKKVAIVTGRKAFPRAIKHRSRKDHESDKEHQFQATRSGAPLPTVILLHDPAQHLHSAMSWDKLGTIKFLTGMGFSVYAIDLPGHGKTRLHTPMSEAEFITGLLAHLAFPRVILVAEGNSVNWVSEYLLNSLAEAEEKVSGVVLVGGPTQHAPALGQLHVFEPFYRIPFIVLLGADDKRDITSVVRQQFSNLRRRYQAELAKLSAADLEALAPGALRPRQTLVVEIIHAGAHPARETPATFHRQLAAFLGTVADNL